MVQLEQPTIQSLADIEAIEKIAFEDRVETWNTYDLIVRGASFDPDRTAMYFLEDADPEAEPVTRSYRELLTRFNQTANLFRELDIGPTDSVVTLLPNMPQVFDAQMGGIAAGIASHVNWMLEPPALIEILRNAKAKVLVALGPTPGFEIWEKVQMIRDQLPELEYVLSVAGPGGTIDPESDFDVRLEAQPGDKLTFTREVGPDDVAGYVHSGGTTGTPKLAKLTHRGFIFKCYANTVVMGHAPGECIFADYPMFHIAGYFGRGILPIINGSSVLIPAMTGARSKNFIANYWKLVERYKIAVLSGVPTTLAVLISNPPTTEDISSLRPYAATGSTALPIEVQSAIERELGIKMLATFGATEFTQNATSPPKDGELRYGSSGIRLPYTELKAVTLGDDGEVERECAVDEIGIIIVRSPGVIPGYVNPAHDVGKFLAGGWINSGDLGRIDAEGYLWITGREKDVIIRGGHNIEPGVIEETLLKHDDVQLAAAVGKPDAYAGELPMAYVQLREGADVTAADIQQFARANIPERAATPNEVIVLDKLPLTDVGKPRKPELRHDAAKRVFSEILGAVDDDGVGIEVDVGDHAVHGTLATVRLASNGSGENAEIERRVHELLDPFQIQHEIVWR